MDYVRGPYWRIGLLFVTIGLVCVPMFASADSPIPVLTGSGQRYPIALFLPVVVAFGALMFLVRSGRAAREALTLRALWRYDGAVVLVVIGAAAVLWIGVAPGTMSSTALRNLCFYVGIGALMRRTGYESSMLIVPILFTILAASLGDGFALTGWLVHASTSRTWAIAVGALAIGLVVAGRRSSRIAIAHAAWATGPQ